MATITDLAASLTLNVAQFSPGVTKAGYSLAWLQGKVGETNESMRQLTQEAEHSQSALGRLNETASSTMAALIGVATASAGMAMGIKLAAEAEVVEKAFETMAGSVKAAQSIIRGARELHQAAPTLATPDILAAGNALLAAERPAQTVVGTLRQLGDIAALTGANIGEIGRAYAKVAASGKVSAQTLNEFSTRNIPLASMLAKQLGVTRDRLSELIKDGDVGFKDFEAAITRATSAGGLFFNGIESQAGTIVGALGALKQTVKDTFQAFGEGFLATSESKEILTMLKDLAHSFQPLARYVGEWAGTIFSVFYKLKGIIVQLYVGFKAFTITIGIGFTILKAMFALKIASWVATFFGLRIAVLAYNSALWLVHAAYKALHISVILFNAIQGPKGWAVLAAGALVAAAAIYAYNRATSTSGSHTKEIADEAERVNKTLVAQVGIVETLGEKYSEAFNKAKDIRMAVQDKLAYFNETPIDAKIREMKAAFAEVNRQTGMANPYNYTRDQQQDMARTRAQMIQLEAMEKEKKINEQIADIQKAAAQANMNESQRKLDDLRREGATAVQIGRMRAALAEQERVAAAKKSREDAISAMKKRIGTAEAPKSLYEQLMGIKNDVGKGFADSPKALLRGTAEADLAANRQKNPVEKLTELQKTQINRLEKQIVIAERQLRVAEANKDVVVQF